MSTAISDWSDDSCSSCLTCSFNRCYMKLYDSPLKSAPEEDDEAAQLLPSQKKKLRQKQRKAEARAKKVNRTSSLILSTNFSHMLL